MQVLRTYWTGTRTAAYDHTVRFFSGVLGLPVEHREGDLTVLRVPDGSTVEVFGPASPFNAHLTCPVVGFLVDDLTAAERELRAAGAEIVLPRTGGDGRWWLHVRAPDGQLYELVEETADISGQAPRQEMEPPVSRVTGGSVYQPS